MLSDKRLVRINMIKHMNTIDSHLTQLTFIQRTDVTMFRSYIYILIT